MRERSLVVCAAAFASAASAQVTMTFSGLSGSEGDAVGAYTENGFTLTEIPFTLDQHFSDGNPAPCVSSQSSVALGDLTKGDSGLFSFQGIDLWSNTSQFTNAQLVVLGQLGGVTVYSEGFVVTADNAWTTFNSANSGVFVDTLRLSFARNDASEIAFDNIRTTNIPAPGALALLAGAGLVAGRRRR